MKFLPLSMIRVELGKLSSLTFSLACLGFIVVNHPASIYVIFFICFVGLVLSFLHRFDTTSLWVGFSVPWLLMLAFSALDISEYSRPLNQETLVLISFLIICLGFFAPKVEIKRFIVRDYRFKERHYGWLYVILLLFLTANVVYSGFVPAFRLGSGEDTGYRDFGIPTFNGMFNAYANALAVTSFYFWCTLRCRRFLFHYFFIISIFLLLVSRQNIVSVSVESFIVYSLTVKKIKLAKLSVFAAIFLSIFAVIGNFRLGEGSISQMAQIKQEYLWLPDSVIWLYSYSYFNLLNVDNAIEATHMPAFDMSSLAGLLPTVLRPMSTGNADAPLEVSAFTVGSFIKPIYADFGAVGLICIFVLFCACGRYYSHALRLKLCYRSVCSYAVIFFCFSFSFFENFWFYLPVVFQLFFVWLFSKVLFGSLRRRPILLLLPNGVKTISNE